MTTRIIAIIAIIISTLQVQSKAQSVAEATASVTVLTMDGALITERNNSEAFRVTFNKITPSRTSGMSKLQTGSKVINNIKRLTVASFNIIASNSYYDISLPPEPLIISRQAGNELITISAFSILLMPLTYADNVLQTQRVEGIINAGSSPLPGLYSSNTPLSVTVNFN